jgi:excisionase family DNA binding protein
VDKLLLTPEEAASVLSIGRSKVYELISDGRLASVRIDASRRVPMNALIEFVERLQEQREPPGVARGRREIELRQVAGVADQWKEAH